MCGIFGVVGIKQDAAEVVLDGLKKLEYRGYDSWGIVIKTDHQLDRERHVGKIGEATTKLGKATIALGHTRWATHGGVTEGNAHPHFDCQEKLCLVHNGIVENFLHIKEQLGKGHNYLSETDTEVALHLVEAEKGSLLKAYRQLTGMNAMILLDASKDELQAVKNGSPLIIGLGKNANYISSDIWALLNHTNKVIILEDGQAARITKDKVEIMDALTGKNITPVITTLDWQKQLSVLGKFHHYMEKEIYDQPKVIEGLTTISEEAINHIAKTIQQATKTLLIGCGTASYAALFGQYLLNFRGIEAEAIVGTEFSKALPLLDSNKAFIALSQSGETIDIIEAVDKAKKAGMHIIGLTNVLGSTLYRKSDYKLLLGAGQEVAVASTKAFTAKLAILIQLAYKLSDDLLAGKKLVNQAAKATAEILNSGLRRQIKTLAKRLKDSQHMFIIGRGLAYPIAMEAAIKIKEVSYIHAESYPGGELKHGPIALIDKGMPCIAIMPQDDTYTDMLSACHEMKARGGLIIGVSPQNHPVFDVHLPVSDLKEATAIPMTTIIQLLAYDLAVVRGLNPDKPRNLAKSVTVK